MPVDPNPSHKPHRVKAARHHAPKGAKNASIAASGGQEGTPDSVMATPSMSVKRGAKGATWKPPSGSSPGGPPSD